MKKLESKIILEVKKKKKKKKKKKNFSMIGNKQNFVTKITCIVDKYNFFKIIIKKRIIQ